MKYELAKQLKDASFPKHKCTDIGGNESVCGLCGQGMNPTLSELIEACGDGFGRLCQIQQMQFKTCWIAYSSQVVNELNIRAHIYQQGDTPEEAVAKLWLKLNNK